MKIKNYKPVSSILLIQDAFFVLILIFILPVSVFSQVRFLEKDFERDIVFKFNNICETSGFNSERINSYQKLKNKILIDSSLKKDTAVFVMKKSPLKSVIYSALLPGLGQFYNQSYWKIPVIWGIGGYFIYEFIRNNNLYIDYRDLYENSISQSLPSGNQRYKTLREFYRDQRDQFILYFGILYLVNIFDAYVDAHLFDFNVSDNFKAGLSKNNLGFYITF